MQPTDRAHAGLFFVFFCACSSVKFDSLFSAFISGLQHVHKALCMYTTQPGMRKSLNLACQMEHVGTKSVAFISHVHQGKSPYRMFGKRRPI